MMRRIILFLMFGVIGVLHGDFQNPINTKLETFEVALVNAFQASGNTAKTNAITTAINNYMATNNLNVDYGCTFRAHLKGVLTTLATLKANSEDESTLLAAAPAAVVKSLVQYKINSQETLLHYAAMGSVESLMTHPSNDGIAADLNEKQSNFLFACGELAAKIDLLKNASFVLQDRCTFLVGALTTLKNGGQSATNTGGIDAVKAGYQSCLDACSDAANACTIANAAYDAFATNTDPIGDQLKLAREVQYSLAAVRLTTGSVAQNGVLALTNGLQEYFMTTIAFNDRSDER